MKYAFGRVAGLCVLIALVSCLSVRPASASTITPTLTIYGLNISWDGTDFSATASNAPLSLWDGVDTFISHGTVTINRLVSSSDYLFEVDETPDLPGGDSDLGLAGAGLLLSGVITSLTQADPFLDIWTLTANLTLSRLGQGDEVTIDMIGFGLDMAEISPAPAAATPVPEPGSIALLATGLAGLWRRRRRQMA